MDRKQCEMLKEIQALEFTAIDFNLYLDTHPEDRTALRDFNRTVIELRELKEKYERAYGPISPMEPESREYWAWAMTPWPWEVCI